MNIIELDQALKSVCPIDGVSVGRKDDPETWRIDFKPEATEEQRSAAQNILAGISAIEPLKAVK